MFDDLGDDRSCRFYPFDEAPPDGLVGPAPGHDDLLWHAGAANA